MRLVAASLITGAAALLLAESGQKKEFTPMQKNWWAFQPVKKQAPPQGPGVTAIDKFLLAKMADKGRTPTPQADRITLLRRASLVLTGLPPTPEETQAFLSDNSANAFEKVIDRLLTTIPAPVAAA